jgi:hypothetical protein
MMPINTGCVQFARLKPKGSTDLYQGEIIVIVAVPAVKNA